MEYNGSMHPSLSFYRSGSHDIEQEYESAMLGWNVPSDYLDYVHPHWRQYKAPHIYQHFLLGFIYAIIFAMGMFGNILVLWAFATSKRLRTPSNLLVANLAIFDTLMMSKLPLFVLNSAVEGQFLGKIGCDLFGLFGAYSGIGASITNAAIAYDRYRTISSPLDGRIGMKQAMVLVAGTWMYATPFSILPMIGVWSRFVPEGYLTTCSFDYLKEGKQTQLYVMTIFGWSYVIPLLLIASFYSRIIVQIRTHERLLKEQAKRMNVKSLTQGQDREKSTEIRVAKVAIGIVILFVCAWTPYAMVAMIGCFSNRLLLTPTLGMIPAVACKTVACIDPWVYAIHHPIFRSEIQKRVPWLCVFGKNSSSDNSSCSGDGATVKEEMSQVESKDTITAA
ncbi:Short wavelength sensitive B opsin 4 [Ladona fulva]|uniref:RhSWa1 protein n=1 Tax=Ladona fulva TaxID=123851 RepID=A0A0C9LM72_LADFU|nr:Short wavelength sensitive B opsin 4 [Ladona fulva]FAA01183.1 TPA: opsin, short-wavelength sensitive type [Ladona fulva]